MHTAVGSCGSAAFCTPRMQTSSHSVTKDNGTAAPAANNSPGDDNRAPKRKSRVAVAHGHSSSNNRSRMRQDRFIACRTVSRLDLDYRSTSGPGSISFVRGTLQQQHQTQRTGDLGAAVVGNGDDHSCTHSLNCERCISNAMGVSVSGNMYKVATAGLLLGLDNELDSGTLCQKLQASRQDSLPVQRCFTPRVLRFGGGDSRSPPAGIAGNPRRSCERSPTTVTEVAIDSFASEQRQHHDAVVSSSSPTDFDGFGVRADVDDDDDGTSFSSSASPASPTNRHRRHHNYHNSCRRHHHHLSLIHI